jgi:protein-tyrosine phosphatase
MSTSDVPARLSVLFVCTGNICRSPTAEAVFSAVAHQRGWGTRVHVDSAGIQGWHAGEPPDERSQDHARKRGYELSAQRARAVRPDDFQRFDVLVAMDRSHLRELQQRCPSDLRHKLCLLPADVLPGHVEVPDPYYGGPDGFDHVLDLLEAGCSRLAENLEARLRL